MELVSPESVGVSSERLQRLSNWLGEQVSSERVAGASVLLSRRGKTVFFEATGRSEVATEKPFQEDTVLRIFSMTKPVTTVAVMMLFEEGCFQLDDPVHRYLPGFKDLRVWNGGELENTVALEQPVTVKHLITHTAGLTYGFMNVNPVDQQYRELGLEFTNREEDLATWTERLTRVPLICQPGSQWNYSVAIDVLGRLVEIWSGMTLEAFFQQRIFEPLGMVDTGFSVRKENHHRFAALYAPTSGASMSNVGGSELPDAVREGGYKLQESATESNYLSPTRLFSGGGGLTSTMADYARFCQMLLNRGELDGVRLLGRKTVEHMRRNQLPGNADMAAMGQPVWSETSYDGIGFGLGWAVVLDPVKANAVTSAGEHHWGGAASTFFWIDPVEDLYVVFMTQLIPSSTYPIRRELRARIYQALID